MTITYSTLKNYKYTCSKSKLTKKKKKINAQMMNWTKVNKTKMMVIKEK